MSLLRCFLAGVLLLLSAPVLSTSGHTDVRYTVSNVYDGDTVELKTHTGDRLKLRLTDIDAPERNQAFGQKARRALTKLCKGSAISVELAGKDKYNRHLGKLQCNQTDASLYMAEHGYAWHNDKYSDNLAIKNAAAAARRMHIGLWGAENPIAPWVWRRLHQNAYPSAR